jgi:hypothetical protein
MCVKKHQWGQRSNTGQYQYQYVTNNNPLPFFRFASNGIGFMVVSPSVFYKRLLRPSHFSLQG